MLLVSYHPVKLAPNLNNQKEIWISLAFCMKNDFMIVEKDAS